MKINCDMGESFGIWQICADEVIMPYIDQANIACGFHASDPHVMQTTVLRAAEHNVSIGAHPSYPDLQGFGRRDMACSHQEIANLIHYQVGALQAISKAHGLLVDYVKPHGALYHAMMRDITIFKTIITAVARLQDGLALMIMAQENNEKHKKIAQQVGVKILFEGFCDRAYSADGSLVPRTQKGAVFDTIEAIQNQARAFINRKNVTTLDGKDLLLVADTLCIHSDSSLAVPAIQAIRRLLPTIYADT